MTFKVYFDHNVVASSPSARPLRIVEHVLAARKGVQVILSDGHLFETHCDWDPDANDQHSAEEREKRRAAIARKYLRFATECDGVWRHSWFEPIRMLLERQEQIDPGSIGTEALRAVSDAAHSSVENGLRSIADAPRSFDPELNSLVRDHKAASLLAEIRFCSGRNVQHALDDVRTRKLVPQPSVVAAFMNPGRDVTIERANREWDQLMRDRADVAEAQRLVTENAAELTNAYARDMLAGHLARLCETLEASRIPLSAIVQRLPATYRRVRFLRRPVSESEALAAIQAWIWNTVEHALPLPVRLTAALTVERIRASTLPRGGMKPLDSNVVDALHASCGFDADLFVVDDRSFASALIDARDRLKLSKPEVVTASEASARLPPVAHSETAAG